MMNTIKVQILTRSVCRQVVSLLRKYPIVARFGSWIYSKYQAIREFVLTLVLASGKGQLSLFYLFKLGRQNLLHSFSRTIVTVGAIASGSAAIVVLVGFAYGLEAIVTNRLVLPNSLRLADVQSSSTAHKLTSETLDQLRNLEGVESIAEAVSLAGSAKYVDSQTEVVVTGARNAFLEATHVQVLRGTTFSDAAEMAYTGEIPDLMGLQAQTEGEVAGVSTDFVPIDGDKVSQSVDRLRIVDGEYVPLRSTPSINSQIVGYVRGSVLESYLGYRVWGGPYESAGTAGKKLQLSTGEWKGEWLSVDAIPLYQEAAPTVFLPLVDDAGVQQKKAGYLAQKSVLVLSKQEAMAETALEKLTNSTGLVLGDTSVAEATDATIAANLLSVVVDKTATNSAREQSLLESIVAESQTTTATSSSGMMIANVEKKGGKEVLVSTAFLSPLKLKPEDVIGKELTLQYIVGAGLVPGINGRVIAQAVTYTIVGVFENEEQSMVYVPLSDLESMGVAKYSIAKVLATSEAVLPKVREKIGALGFTTRSISDTLQQVNKLFSVMRFLLGSFGMIAFIVALFGMFNTLTVSLLERTREIGVMKTFGTTDADITRLLLVESSLIGISGGFFGVLFGILIGNGVNVLTLIFREDKSLSLFHFPILFLVFVFMLAALVGMLTGLYPARRAHKISALNALRYE